MKITSVLLAVAALGTSAVIAQENPTTELLAAKPVTSFIRIGLVQQARGGDAYSLQYGIDDFQDLDPLTDGVVFRTEAGTDIYLANFNPLLQTFSINAEATADVSYASLKAFLEDVEKARANLTPAPPAPGGALTAANRTACEELIARIGALHTALNTPELSPSQLKTIVESAVGFAGVKQAAADLQQRKDAIDGNVKTAEEALKLLRTEFSSIGGAPATRDCLGAIKTALADDRAKLDADKNKLAATAKARLAKKKGSTAALDAEISRLQTAIATTEASILSLESQQTEVEAAIERFNKLQKEAEDLISKKKKLSDSIAELLKSLDPYLVMAKWRGPIPNNPDNLTDLDFTTVTPDFVNQQKVTVTAKAKDVVIEKDVIVVKELEASKKTAGFRVRQDSFFIPERAAAVVYNRLKYPKYASKKDDAGKTVVARTEDEDPWNAAVLLNLVMRLRATSVANPMIQIGVSTAKEYPGLLAGVGLRFTRPIALGLSIGGMVTRYKDLDDDLQVGSEVTGDADIEKHLELKTSPVVPYIALQIKF